jgi:hypothetical protein
VSRTIVPFADDSARFFALEIARPVFIVQLAELNALDRAIPGVRIGRDWIATRRNRRPLASEDLK